MGASQHLKIGVGEGKKLGKNLKGSEEFCT